MNSQVTLASFIGQNKPVKWLFFSMVALIFFILSLSLNWPLYYFLGFIFTGLLTLLLFYRPLSALFLLVVIRMLLDYPSERFFITILDSYILSFSQVIGIIILLAGIIYLAGNSSKLKKLPLKIPILFYFLFLAFTSIYSIDTFSTIKELSRLFDLMFLFFLSFITINSKERYNSLLKVIIFSSLVPVAVGIYQYIFHIGYTDAIFSTPRIFGTFSHPNPFSLYLVSIVAAMLIYYFLNKNIKTGTFVAILIPFYLLVILLTYTRVAWIAILIFLVALGMFKFRKSLVFMLVIIITMYIFSPSVQERANEAIYQSPGNSISWRLALWKDSIAEILTNKRQVLGYGANTFEIVTENRQGLKRGSVAAHNDFVRSFVEGGYVGLMVFLFYLAYILIYLFNRYRKSNNSESRVVFLILTSLFFAIVIASFTDNIMRNTPLQWIFWIILGASLRVFSDYKNMRGRVYDRVHAE